MRAMIASLPAASFGPESRPFYDALMERTPNPAGVSFEAASVGGVPGWWCCPDPAVSDVAILYLHGGAYVIGSAAAYRNFVRQIAIRAKAAVFIAEYGLAPEHPFPAAIDDALAAYGGLVAAGFGRIAIAGDSAGGGLTLALLPLLTESVDSDSRPVAAAVMSPWIDLALTSASIDDRAASDPVLSRATLQKSAGLYLNGQDPNDARVSALRAQPTTLPVQIHVGDDEVLLDDSRRYFDRIDSAGGKAELHIWKGMGHVFPAKLALMQAAREALDLTGAFLHGHLGLGG